MSLKTKLKGSIKNPKKINNKIKLRDGRFRLKSKTVSKHTHSKLG
jgi:hypothetical protein